MTDREPQETGPVVAPGLLARLGRGFRRWQDARRLRAELADVSDGELSDMGFTREDLDSYFRGRPHTPRAMAAMMKRFGIGASDVPLSRWHALVEAQQTCRKCRRAVVCRETLRWGPDQESLEEHCPNRAFLSEIAEIARRR